MDLKRILEVEMWADRRDFMASAVQAFLDAHPERMYGTTDLGRSLIENEGADMSLLPRVLKELKAVAPNMRSAGYVIKGQPKRLYGRVVQTNIWKARDMQDGAIEPVRNPEIAEIAALRKRVDELEQAVEHITKFLNL